jgi:hypothetical protein
MTLFWSTLVPLKPNWPIGPVFPGGLNSVPESYGKATLNCSIIYDICGLYYKPIMIINDDSRVVNKFETSLTDYAIVVICDRHAFIVQATCVNFINRSK